MVICKFFLQGNCRFGDYCKFEHQFGDAFTNIQQKNSTSILRQPHFGGSQPAKPPNPANSNAVDANTLVKSVVNDMTVAERGGQWLLSSYGPCKEQPSFPGFEDQSFEEIRLGYYDARKNGTVEQYKQQIQMMLQQAMLKLKSLQSPSPDIVNLLKSLYATQQQPQSGIFGGNTFGTNSTFSNVTNTTAQPSTFNQQPSASIFAQANQSLFANKPAESNIFGGTQNTSIFGGQTNSSTFAGQANNQPFGGQVNSSPFGGQSNNPPFVGQTNSSPFGAPTNSSPFGGSQPQVQSPNKNVFAQASVNPTTGASIFGASTGSNPIAGGNIFGNAQATNTMFNTQQPTTPFGNTPLQNTLPATQPQVANNVFVKQQQPTNIFGGQNTTSPFNPSMPVFGRTPNQTVPQTSTDSTRSPLFPQQSVFAHQTQQLASNSPFGAQAKTNLEAQQSNIFGNRQPPAGSLFGGHQQQEIDETIYSKLEDLTEEEIKWFESDTLDIMNIPEKPPTVQMCFKT